jgi:hypothetical protein
MPYDLLAPFDRLQASCDGLKAAADANAPLQLWPRSLQATTLFLNDRAVGDGRVTAPLALTKNDAALAAAQTPAAPTRRRSVRHEARHD